MSLRERGLDISDARAKALTEFDVSSFDYVLTLCDRANEECPSGTAKVRRLHWSLPDPTAAPDLGEGAQDVLQPFRRVRDALEDILNEFVGAHRKSGYPERAAGTRVQGRPHAPE